mgnify:CR=1 FL=1
MKRIYTLLFLCVVACMSLWAQPKISFDMTTKDLGYVLWRTPATVTYQFTNTGDKPLVISNVTTSCGCAKAQWTEEPVPAGGKGKITVVFDAEAIGHFYKDVGVYCNAASSPVLMHLPPYLEAKAEPEKLGRGKTGKLLVTLDSEKLPKLGITRASVYLSRFPGDKVGSENEIPVSVALLPDFSKLTEQQKNNPPQITLSAKELEFVDLKPNQKKSQTIVISNTGRSDLNIQDMQVFSMALAVKLKKRVLKPGESTKMKITVLAQNLHRVKGTPRVLMITDDPNQPMITIRVKARLKSSEKYAGRKCQAGTSGAGTGGH